MRQYMTNRKKINSISFRIENDLFKFLKKRMINERKSLSQVIIDLIYKEYKDEKENLDKKMSRV